MNEMIDWNDLRLFLQVARAGGLAPAMAATGVSAPTLGRRMVVLERALGVELFLRRRDGYDLTADGEQLLRRAEVLEEGALGIERWRSAAKPTPRVRIAAGAWTSSFLAGHLKALTAVKGAPDIEILSGAGLADLVRREAELGIRNRRPEQRGLAGRRLGSVAFAVYGAPEFLVDQPTALGEERYTKCDWVALATGDNVVPSTLWLEQRLGKAPRLGCHAPWPLLDAATAGVGLCVLPCFIGDSDSRLARASEPILELRHDQWLVSHDDDRHTAPIRRTANGLARLFRDHKALFAGHQT
ncbi:MAG: LysR family transcriptional regulator [Pseudomonadota bacterium]